MIWQINSLGEDGELGYEINSESSAFSRKCDLVPFQLVENSAIDSKPSTVIPRKESSGDLLPHLPRIASLPQFFVFMRQMGWVRGMIQLAQLEAPD